MIPSDGVRRVSVRLFSPDCFTDKITAGNDKLRIIELYTLFSVDNKLCF